MTITGTHWGGDGTPFQATGTISGGGALTNPLVVTVVGVYTANPASLSAEPITGGSLAGATVTLTMGVLTAALAGGGSLESPPANPASTTNSGAASGCQLNVTYGPGSRTPPPSRGSRRPSPARPRATWSGASKRWRRFRAHARHNAIDNSRRAEDMARMTSRDMMGTFAGRTNAITGTHMPEPPTGRTGPSPRARASTTSTRTWTATRTGTSTRRRPAARRSPAAPARPTARAWTLASTTARSTRDACRTACTRSPIGASTEMAHVGNGASVRAAAPGYTDAMRRPANPRTGDHQPLQIPPGGHAHIEKAEDGTVIATAHDRNYRRSVGAPRRRRTAST